MSKERRWMTSAVKEAARTNIEMPWARGNRRKAFIAKRTAVAAPRAARA